MKKWLKGVVACGVAFMVVVGMASFAHAGGVINWKVKVTNASGHLIRVFLWYDVKGKEFKEKTINAGESVTLETGNKCPYQLGGWVYDEGKDIVRRCADGSTDACFVTCADTQWKVKLHGDGAYHFDKD